MSKVCSAAAEIETLTVCCEKPAVASTEHELFPRTVGCDAFFYEVPCGRDAVLYIECATMTQ